jgi:hypothetical protein
MIAMTLLLFFVLLVALAVLHCALDDQFNKLAKEIWLGDLAT